MTRRFELHVKEKGRTVLPAALRAACGFDTGVTLLVRPIGPGQAIIETADAVLGRLWDGIPDGSDGAVEAVREFRDKDRALLDARSERASIGDDDSDTRRATALRILGLS